MGGVLLPPIRAPSGLSGALFTSRDTHTLLFIWAGPLTSTAKGFFQGMSGSKLLGGLAGSTDERETRQKAPPFPSPPLGDLNPLPPPSFLSPQRPPIPCLWAWHRGNLIPRTLSSSSPSPCLTSLLQRVPGFRGAP